MTQRTIKNIESRAGSSRRLYSGDGLTRDLSAVESSSQLWMRSVSFAGLQRVLQILASHSNGLAPAELNLLIKERGIYETRRGAQPAPTTLYHCRNTLLQLNAVLRDGQRLVANLSNPFVQALINRPAQTDGKLDDVSCGAFAELVLQNRDCKVCFFDLFMEHTYYSVHDFRSGGSPVSWRRKQDNNSTTSAVTLQASSEREVGLDSPSEINAVLYGLRYWAHELRLIDEFFREKRGLVMYPVLIGKEGFATEEIVSQIVSLCGATEWTTLSIQDLIELCGEKNRRPVSQVFAAVRKLLSGYSGHVVSIPTSRSFATLTAGFNEQRQELELKSYCRDSHGRYISHIRIHKSIRSELDA